MKIESDVPLSSKTSLRVGGPARFWCQVETLTDLSEALDLARDRRLPILVIGGGTNLVPADAGFPGLAVGIANRELNWSDSDRSFVSGAGVSMTSLVDQTIAMGWAGLAWAGGLPGTLGGAIRGNAGAFGGETRDSIISVDVFDLATGALVTLDRAACGFSYRTSGLKNQSIIIWSAKLEFTLGEVGALVAERDEHIQYRQTHHPIEPSAGSIFKNLYVADLPTDFFDRFPELAQKVRGEKIAVGALLDALNMKGRSVGGAVVSDRHANMIINPAGLATGSDVRGLVGEMKDAVRERFGIVLQEEPEFL